MTVGIYSFATPDLNKDILYYQKEVFKKFNLNINQFIATGYHGKALMKIIDQAVEDYIIFFDIDCIPLDKSFYNILLDQIKDGNTLSGGRGCCISRNMYEDYIHPSFMGFKKSLYYECGSPNLRGDKKNDCAQVFTNRCRDKGKNLKFWEITHSDDYVYENASGRRWGHGCVIEHVIYHQHEINLPQQHDPFFRKCKEVLNMVSRTK